MNLNGTEINIDNLNEPHLALVFLLDTSCSMNDAISNYVNALNEFIVNAKKDYLTYKRIDITIIKFNDTVEIVQDFIPISKMKTVELSAYGLTTMGHAINLAIDKTKERIRLYNELGMQYYKPLIVMFTDGYPTDDMECAKQRLNEQVKNNKLNFFAIGASSNCDFWFLRELTRNSVVLDYKEYDDIFSWLLDGMKKISHSQVDEIVEFSKLPKDSHILDFWD